MFFRKDWSKILFMIFCLFAYIFLDNYLSPPPQSPPKEKWVFKHLQKNNKKLKRDNLKDKKLFPPTEKERILKNLEKERARKFKRKALRRGKTLFYKQNCIICHGYNLKFAKKMKQYPLPVYKHSTDLKASGSILLKEKIIACILRDFDKPSLIEEDRRIYYLEAYLKRMEETDIEDGKHLYYNKNLGKVGKSCIYCHPVSSSKFINRLRKKYSPSVAGYRRSKGLNGKIIKCLVKKQGGDLPEKKNIYDLRMFLEKLIAVN